MQQTVNQHFAQAAASTVNANQSSASQVVYSASSVAIIPPQEKQPQTAYHFDFYKKSPGCEHLTAVAIVI